MTRIEPGRLTTTNDQDIVVFLIGARVNKWWLLPLALPMLARMRNMQRELLADPNSGLIGIQTLGSADVQYWRSLEDLTRYADDRTRTHRGTAASFYKKLFKNQAVGIWHETYFVRAGAYESLYVNMPAHGLGRFTTLVPAAGARNQMSGRFAPQRTTLEESTRQARSG